WQKQEHAAGATENVRAGRLLVQQTTQRNGANTDAGATRIACGILRPQRPSKWQRNTTSCKYIHAHNIY
ncbi:MAG: hypothetical protein ACKPKO_10155, partial [Candidatus Fonsibacter sp.]